MYYIQPTQCRYPSTYSRVYHFLQTNLKRKSTSDTVFADQVVFAMPRTIQELQKRVLDLEKLNRCQAVKIWQLEEEKMDLVEKVERLVRKEGGMGEQSRESNQDRTAEVPADSDYLSFF